MKAFVSLSSGYIMYNKIEVTSSELFTAAHCTWLSVWQLVCDVQLHMHVACVHVEVEFCAVLC